MKTRTLGAPGLDFQTWETMNLSSPFPLQLSTAPKVPQNQLALYRLHKNSFPVQSAKAFYQSSTAFADPREMKLCPIHRAFLLDEWAATKPNRQTSGSSTFHSASFRGTTSVGISMGLRPTQVDENTNAGFPRSGCSDLGNLEPMFVFSSLLIDRADKANRMNRTLAPAGMLFATNNAFFRNPFSPAAIHQPQDASAL